MSNTVVRTNVMSLNAHRNLGLVSNQQSQASRRLSSGFRINSAADDAAGLGISEKMRAQIRGLDQASRNGQDGISLIQTAEGAMATVNEMVIRIRELVVQAANDTNAHNEANAANWSQSDRTKIQDEINQLLAEIDATAARTQFNTRNLIDGSLHGLSPSARLELNLIVSDNMTTITGLAQANNNLAQSDGALAALNNNIRILSEFQSAVEGIMSIANVNAILANNNWTSTAAAGSGLTNALVEQLNATGLFNRAVTSDDISIAADMFVSPTGQGPDTTVKLLNGDGQTQLLVDAREELITRWLGGVGTDFITTITYGADADGTDPEETDDFELELWSDLADVMEAMREARDDIRDARQTNLDCIRDHTNTLNSAIRSNADLRRYVSDWNTAESMLQNPGAQALWFQVGANPNQGVNLSIANIDVNALNRVGAFADSGVEHGFNFGNLRTNGTTFTDRNTGVMRESGEEINKFLTAIDFALSHVTAERSRLGAMQNRLEFTIENLDIASENLSAAESRIRDADMAKEMMRLTQANVLQQAAISMLAQANQAPQSVLQLLG